MQIYKVYRHVKGYTAVYLSPSFLSPSYWKKRENHRIKKNISPAICGYIITNIIANAHREIFLILNKSTRNQIVYTIFRLIWNQTQVCLVPNQSENGTYNLISGWFNKISKRFLCVHPQGHAQIFSKSW